MFLHGLLGLALITGWVLWEDPPPAREVPEFAVQLHEVVAVQEEKLPPVVVEPPLEVEPEILPVVEVMAAPERVLEELPPPVDYPTEQPWKPRHLRFRNNLPPKQPQEPEVQKPFKLQPVTPPEPQATVVMAPHIDDAQCPPPDYPRRAQRNHWYGLTMLLVDIDANGNPSKVTVTTSSGYKILDDAAVAAVETWHFFPAMRNGVAEAGQLRVPIRFAAPQ